MSNEHMDYNGRVEACLQDEYPMLKGQVYLDHAGTTLYAKSLMDNFVADMTSNLFGNPHSASASSQSSMARIDDIRVRVLQFFNADPANFDLVFVANATAGVKLVTEAFRAQPRGFAYAYHQACHTSLVGVRQEATHSQCVDSDTVEAWLDGGPLPGEFSLPAPKLFAYPAQSNMNGQRFSLEWPRRLRERKGSACTDFYTLLDAASYVATSPLDLSNSETAPDFTVLSFYKIFGFPDLGALIVRRQAAPIFRHRKFFGGGTVDTVVCMKEQWHAPKTQTLHDALEDGTLPIHSIMALGSAIPVHSRLFGSMQDISLHTAFLAQRLRGHLSHLQHGNGSPVCKMYSSERDSPLGLGPIVAFNLMNKHGAWVSPAEFEKLASLKGFHIRTGGLCNPGGIASALGLEPWEMKRNFSAGFRCGSEDDVVAGKPTGVIRVSFGPMSVVSDVDEFATFVREFYLIEEESETSSPADREAQAGDPDLFLQAITVYPIKSCGGYSVPSMTAWEVRPEGLAWDREWCLVHRASGQVLSQKRYPRMTLLRPKLDFARGVLEVSYAAKGLERPCRRISVPLSADPALFSPGRPAASRVCGEDIVAQTYRSSALSEFFSEVLEVPCLLARFPSGGQGRSRRHAKAHLQLHQKTYRAGPHVPGAFPGLSTPPDSDGETEQRPILLSNESPILAINLASLASLNREVVSRGGSPVPAEAFRANVVVGSLSEETGPLAYAEDHWSTMRIGEQDFRMLGSCRRCHMVCIDQNTAAKSEEPFTTLSKTRRFGGKVFFGTHMCHEPRAGDRARDARLPLIRVGDKVTVDGGA